MLVNVRISGYAKIHFDKTVEVNVDEEDFNIEPNEAAYFAGLDLVDELIYNMGVTKSQTDVNVELLNEN